MKHYNIALGVAFSGIVLTGCVFNEQKVEPVKPQTVTEVKSDTDIKLDKDLALARFMFENKNDAKAFETFLTYAAQGNTEAEAWLGRCYLNGIGTPINYDKAFEYFSKAAVKNHPYGINGLGVCKQYGYGTDIDLRAAIDYYKKAADMGFPLATLKPMYEQFCDHQIENDDHIEAAVGKILIDTYGNGKTGTMLDLMKALMAYSDTALAFFNK